MDGVELAPLRPLNDFLLEGARFQVPNLNDLERYSNRIINNLLYYQTNYFLSTIFLFLCVGFYYPVQMVTGIVIITLAFLAFVYFTNNTSEWRRLKAKHPIISVLTILFVTYVLTRAIGAIFVFLFGLLLPIALTIIHASLRMRNINNKIARFKEYVGLKRTPMGVILEALGQEQEAGS